VALEKAHGLRRYRAAAQSLVLSLASISTATKYRNTTTTQCYPARLGAAHPCSGTNMVAVAGSSG
jgi:hypothetical protein